MTLIIKISKLKDKGQMFCMIIKMKDMILLINWKMPVKNNSSYN